MDGKGKVLTVVCPQDVFAPQSAKADNKRKFKETTSDEPAKQRYGQSYSNVRGGRNDFGEKDTEMTEIMSSIREFSSTTLKGQSRLKHKDDKLVKLGAAPAKQQTMPFKMAMGIRRGREKRAQKEIAIAKESGRVLAVNRGSGIAESFTKRTKEKDADFNIHSKKGVFHLDRKRIPSLLINKGLAASRKR